MEIELDLRLDGVGSQIEVIRSQIGKSFTLAVAKSPSDSALLRPTNNIVTQPAERAIVEFVSNLDSILLALAAVAKTLRVAVYVDEGEAAAFGIELSRATMGILSSRDLNLDVMFFPCGK